MAGLTLARERLTMGDDDSIVLGSVTFPPRPQIEGFIIDGAIAELQHHDDGTITADIRIPGPKEG